MDARTIVMVVNRSIDVPSTHKLMELTIPAYVDHVLERRTDYNPGRHIVKVTGW
jgi:hypothetical protein